MPDHQLIYQTQGEKYQQLIDREDYQNNLFPAMSRIVDLEDAAVLDLGAGTGRVACLIADQVGSLIALDASHHMLTTAVNRLAAFQPQHWLAAAAEHQRIPLPDNLCHSVISGWSFSYLKTWAAADWSKSVWAGLEEVRRILKPRGTFLVIETLGTGTRSPVRMDALQEYFQLLEQEGFQHDWIRTDYQFSSREEGETLTSFFFGKEMVENLMGEIRPILPECTGLWWRRF